MDQSNIEQFRAALRKSKRITAIAGAGLSAGSGIPTFRGAGGLWRTFNAMELATPDAFDDNPSRVWQFYHYRRESALKAKPNAAHYALAALSIPERLKAIAPDAAFRLITQNIELSGQALNEIDPSRTTDVLEMHGRLFETICNSCGHREPNRNSPICSSLVGTENNLGTEVEVEIPLEDLPRCDKCNGLLRPGVVWFEEVPHHLDEIDMIVAETDVVLVVGTSSKVYPAAGYAREVAKNGGIVAVFNIELGLEDAGADFVFLGPCEKTLPQALGLD